MQRKHKIRQQRGSFGYKVLTYTEVSEHERPILTSTRTFDSKAEAQAYIEYMRRQETREHKTMTLL